MSSRCNRIMELYDNCWSVLLSTEKGNPSRHSIYTNLEQTGPLVEVAVNIFKPAINRLKDER